MQVMINDVMSQLREIDARIEAVQRESLPIMEKTDRILALFEEGRGIVFKNSQFQHIPHGRRVLDYVWSSIAESVGSLLPDNDHRENTMTTMVLEYRDFCNYGEDYLEAIRIVLEG